MKIKRTSNEKKKMGVVTEETENLNVWTTVVCAILRFLIGLVKRKKK